MENVGTLRGRSTLYLYHHVPILYMGDIGHIEEYLGNKKLRLYSRVSLKGTHIFSLILEIFTISSMPLESESVEKPQKVPQQKTMQPCLVITCDVLRKVLGNQ